MPALLGRALPRESSTSPPHSTATHDRKLLELAFTRDAGLRAADAVLAAQQLDRLQDNQFTPYQLPGPDLTALRQRFASWPRLGQRS